MKFEHLPVDRGIVLQGGRSPRQRHVQLLRGHGSLPRRCQLLDTAHRYVEWAPLQPASCDGGSGVIGRISEIERATNIAIQIMLTKLAPTLGPTPFTSQTDFGTAMNNAGNRADGPLVLAIWAGRVSPGAKPGRLEGRMHSHLRGQLMCIDNGHMQVRTDQGSWLVPPNRAVWVPGGERHAVTSSGVTSSWSLFLSPLAGEAMPPTPCVIGVNELVRALAQRAATWREVDRLDTSQRRLAIVLVDEIRRAPQDPLHLPMPKDRRLVRIANAIVDDPADARTKEEWASWAGLSERTLTRQFQAQVNMSFAQWRQQALLIHALERLLKGENVTTVSDTLGYASPSNFITMFRKALGYSPAHYVARGGG